MTVSLNVDPVYKDTRGLPEGFNPGSLFQYRYNQLVESATGLESLAYRLIPMSYIRSWTFALDPLYRYKVAPGTITAANRTRVRRTLSVTDIRTRVRRRSFRSWSQLSNYKGIAICGSPYLVDTNAFSYTIDTANLTVRQPEVWRSQDTTGRTRIIGSTQGELEMFKPSVNSPPRTSVYRNEFRAYTSGFVPGPECLAVGGTRDYEVGSSDVYTMTFGPSAAVFPESSLTALRVSETARCKSLCSEHAVSMLKGISPFTRSYSLARNIAELKDLPRSINQLRQTAGDLKAVYASLTGSPKLRSRIFDLSSKAASNIPGEYLSYHFGWRQLHRDLRELLALPEKLSKKINFLIRRSGKQTTFRSKRNFLSGESGLTSGFVYDHTNGDKEWGCTHSHRIQRETEIRLVINGTFDFPTVNVPHFRENFYLDQVGLIPRFTDVYNIIPWTWLVDWFTGFGNYLELIEETNHDPLLINWGLITAVARGSLTTEFSYRNATQNDIYVNTVRVSPEAATDATKYHTSVLDFECTTRMNVARVLDVERTTEPESLSGYRQSILAALLASRVDNTRSGTFRPRS